MLLGLLWLFLGIFFIIDALVEEIRIPSIYFTIPLFLDGTWSLFAGFSKSGATRSLRLAKAGVFYFIILVIFASPAHGDMVIGLIAGTFLVVDACWRGASAFVVRFEGWKVAIGYSVVEFLSGVWSFLPWPTYWQGEIAEDVGTLLILSSAGILTLAARIRRLPPDKPILSILNRGWPSDHKVPLPDALHPPFEPGPEVVTVHVWTPTTKIASLHRGISRYIAAEDEKGVISTGHASLELPPDVYVSLYPAEEIDRNQSEFRKTLCAERHNDVAGEFKTSYEEESKEWCPSNFQIRIKGLNTQAIRSFWEAYRQDSRYNLTDRSCASSVAKALDAGLEGIFEKYVGRHLFLLRLLLTTPELWVAGFMRKRAAAMAWTPGIVLDYARALAYVVSLAEQWEKKTEDTAK